LGRSFDAPAGGVPGLDDGGSRRHRGGDGGQPLAVEPPALDLPGRPGYLIMQAGDYLNTALVFSGIIAIAILGLALDACLRGLLLLADPSRRQ
jgi:hypothetical protein